MPLKNDWQNGDLFTPAAANDMANAVNDKSTEPARAGIRSSVLGTKLRGGNIVVKPGFNWNHLIAEWDWDNWIKPQIDRAVKLGLNAVRMISGPRVILEATVSWTAWVGSTSYSVGNVVSKSGKAYQCTTAGTSASSGGPTGTGSSITDGTVTWRYLREDNLAPITQSQYDARWAQLVEYAGANSLAVYPCLCTTEDFDAIAAGSYQNATVTASITTTAAALAKYPNVIGFDVFQEGSVLTGRTWQPNKAYVAPFAYVNNGGKSYLATVSGTSASSGGPTGTGSSISDGTVTWSYQGIPLVADDVLALFAAIRSVCNVPLTVSAGGWDATSSFWTNEPFLWYLVHSNSNGSDFIDHHLYGSTLTSELVETYADLFNGKPTLIGEFGSNESLASGEQTDRFESVAETHSRPGVTGSFVWALADQGITSASKFGVWDNTGFVQGTSALSTTTGKKSTLTDILRSFVMAHPIPKFRVDYDLTGSSGTAKSLVISPTVNQSSTAAYTAVDVSVTESSTGSGNKKLISASVGGAEKFFVDALGRLKVGGIVYDLNGNVVLGLSPAASAVNYLGVLNSAAGSSPQISAEGTDTNVNVILSPKNTGAVVVNAPTGVTPRIAAASPDTDANINIQSKGSGVVQANGSTVLVSGGALGTPSSGTLTNCTFPTLNQNTTGSAATLTTGRDIQTDLASGTAASFNGSAAITPGVTGTLPVANGGTGATTLTGLVKGSGTSALSAATAGTDYLAPTDATADELTTGEATMPRRMVSSQLAGSGNGNLRLTYFTARKTETITQVRTITGSTAGVGPTLCRIGVYSVAGNGDLTLIASTANDTALWIGNGAYTKSFSASFSKVRGTRYALATLVVGTSTAPSYTGCVSLVSTEAGIDPRISGFVASQTDLPASVSAGSISNTGHSAYAVLLP
jgi:hypothetical protein